MRFAMVLVFVVFILCTGGAKAQTNAQAVVDRAIKAHGGIDQVRKLRAAQLTLVGTSTEPGTGTLAITLKDAWQLPDKYRTESQFEYNGMKVTRVLVIEGDSGWVALNGSKQAMDKASLDEMKEQLYAESLDKLVPLLDTSRFKLSAIGQSNLHSVKVFGVKVSATGHRDVSLYFDEATGLLVKRAELIKGDIGKAVLREVVFRDYNKINGLQFPRKVIGYYDGKKVVEGQVTEFSTSRVLDPLLFTRP